MKISQKLLEKLRRFIVLLGTTAFVAGLSLSCKTTGATGGTDINAGIGLVADCGKASVLQVAKEKLTEVETNLLVEDWKDQLLTIASNIGEETLSCIIDHIITRSKIDVRASKDPIEQVKIDRGQEWIMARKVTFIPPTGGGK